MAEWASANAVTKAYEDTMNEDNEQHLGSDDRNDEPLPIFLLLHIINDNVTGTYCEQMIPEGVDNDPSNIYDETHSSFWERMTLRMSRPQPTPAPFAGDPAQYL